MRYQLARPSLKITGRTEQPRTDRFVFEVWNPFLRTYQPVVSVEEGVRRTSELADLIGRMWTRQHPKLVLLADVPDADVIDRARWAELRINPANQRGCDTRQDDHTAWVQAAGLVQATETVCTRVGCTPRTDDVPHIAAELPPPIIQDRGQDRGMHG